MFEELFKQPHALARHRGGPLVEERVRYLRHLADQEMRRGVLRNAAAYLLVVCDYLDLADRSTEKIGHKEIEEKALLWAEGRGKSDFEGKACCRNSRRQFSWFATQWLSFLGRLHEPPAQASPHAGLLAAYAEYMRHEKELSPKTIRYRCDAVEEFLSRFSTTGVPLREITINKIDRLLIEKVNCGRYARVTVQTYTGTLRCFFRYAEMHGWCRSGLAAGIKAPRVFSQERLPAGPSWKDVQRLLATTE